MDYNPICPSLDNVPRGLRAEPATHMQFTQRSASVCFPLGISVLSGGNLWIGLVYVASSNPHINLKIESMPTTCLGSIRIGLFSGQRHSLLIRHTARYNYRYTSTNASSEGKKGSEIEGFNSYYHRMISSKILVIHTPITMN